LENKKEKAFLSLFLLSAILAQNPAAQPAPSLSLSRLTGGAHPSGSSPPPNRRPEYLSRLEPPGRSLRAHVLLPRASVFKLESPSRTRALPLPILSSPCPCPARFCAENRRREVLRRPRLGCRSEPFSLRFGAVVSFISLPAPSPSCF